MKSGSENIYKQKVNQVIDHINFNSHQPLQLNIIADIVNMSQRQLLRMMSSALNIGLSFDDPNVTKPAQCRFYACTSAQKEIVSTCEFGIIRLSQGKYAVHTLQGYYTDLQDWYNIINASQEYSFRYEMSFEEYTNYSKENITKIYTPIK